MKFLYLLQSIICAVTLSVLSIVYASGNFSLQKKPEAAVKEEDKQEQPLEKLIIPRDKEGQIDELIFSLKQELASFEVKSKDLNNREAEYDRQQKLTIALKAELEKLQFSLTSNMLKIEEAEEVNMKRLAKVYSKMDPANAGKLLSAMDDKKVAKILTMIEDRQAAGILNAVITDGGGAAKAALWSNLIQKIMKKEKKEA